MRRIRSDFRVLENKMSIKLEQIEGMKLKTGDKIEFKVEHDEEVYASIGYFIGVDSGKYLDHSTFFGVVNGKDSFWRQQTPIVQIQDIKILDYKKQIQPERSEDELTR